MRGHAGTSLLREIRPSQNAARYEGSLPSPPGPRGREKRALREALPVRLPRWRPQEGATKLPSVPQKYFDIEGVPTFVHHTGETTLPGVPPVFDRGEAIVCLHGAGNNGHLYAELAELLSEHHSPVAFDQPGHARSGGLDSLGSIGAMADFTRAVADRLSLPLPRVLLGHSMGGAVATEVALRDPQGVRALILCSTPAAFEIPDFLLDGLRRVTEGKDRRRFERGVYSPSTPDEIVHRGFMEDAKTDPRVMYADLKACRDWQGGERLGALEVPTLVVHGVDELAPLAEGSEKLAATIPGARLERLEGAGHMVPIEKTPELAGLITSFLGALDA